MEFSDKSLKILELPVVLDMLVHQAVSLPAKEKAAALLPSREPYEVKRRLAETSAAVKMMVVKGSPSFSGVKDVRGALARADMGGSLNTRELLDIAGVLQAARTVRSYANADELGATEIDFLFHSLQANRYLEDRISGSILGEDEIADAASSELADIRRHMRATSAKIRDTLQKIISSPTYSKALQESIITTRSDRYVVPVKAEYKGSVPGLVHDISSSGATLFIEPMGVVKANNEMRELQAKEKKEIERILAELSAECAAHRDDICRDFDVLVALDVIFAKAKLSYKLDCTSPEISDGEVVLRRARHPLLDQAKAVPIDIELGGSFDTLVITGPNTGGKTVSLKTLGLLNLMAQCGLHIPAAAGSRLPVFGKILADIGDEQSIEQSLSTFSAHMTNIVSILEECDDSSLLLFDELGAGTDPAEGAALAISIIENARRKGAVIAATTHYAELKIYATNTPGVQNASCEFDVDSLRPTYKLLIGIPGKSNAFAISARLGLPDVIINDAKERAGTDSADFEAMIEKLEAQRQQMERNRLETAKTLREAEETARKNEQLRRELSVRLEMAEEKARREATVILEEARATADRVYHELDEMRKKAAEDGDVQRTNEARSQLRQQLNQAAEKLGARKAETTEKKVSARPVMVGDIVEILSMGMKAEVKEISPARVLTLQAGAMKISAREDEVYLISGGKTPTEAKKQPQKTGVTLRGSSAPSEIDLRGFTAEEGVAAAEQFIDNAVMSKLQTLRIIHGKGTGVLRQAIQQMLRKNKFVKSFRLGVYGEGETGVTVVELK